jgi:predicted SprT family Zn-dependent metalloprotease
MASYNEHQLTEKVKELAKQMFGWELTKPVIIDGRLTRAWATAHFIRNRSTRKIELKCFKFAKRYVSGDYKEEDIVNTIKHELVHWYTNITEGYSCNHNYIWKENCVRFGVVPEATASYQKVEKPKWEAWEEELLIAMEKQIKETVDEIYKKAN